MKTEQATAREKQLGGNRDYFGGRKLKKKNLRMAFLEKNIGPMKQEQDAMKNEHSENSKRALGN